MRIECLAHQTVPQTWLKPGPLECQRVYHSGLTKQWHQLRTRVPDLISWRKKEFYERKGWDLKTSDPRKCWSMVNHLARNSKSSDEISYAACLNKYFISVTSDIPPLEVSKLPSYLPSLVQPATISKAEVHKKFQVLVPSRPQGLIIPLCILKDFSPELAGLVATIFNHSLVVGLFPAQWKDSNVTPVPMTTPIKDDGT